MTFIVQCPHPDCRKYMLLEDAARGTKVDCLICRKKIEVDSSGSGDRQKAPPLPQRPPPRPSPSGISRETAGSETPPPVVRQKIVNCPQCSAPLRLPPEAVGKALKCPRCSHVFKP
jgi:hypothetical protein